MPSTTWLSRSHWDALSPIRQLKHASSSKSARALGASTLSSTTAPRGYPPPPSATPRDSPAPAAPSTPIRRPVGTARSHERPSAVDARPSALDRRVDSRGDLPPPPLSRPLARSTRQPDCEDERWLRSPRSRQAPAHDASEERALARTQREERARACTQREDDRPSRSATRNETARAHAQRDAPSTRAVSPPRYEQTRMRTHHERAAQVAAQATPALDAAYSTARRLAAHNANGRDSEGEGTRLANASSTTRAGVGERGREGTTVSSQVRPSSALSQPPRPRVPPAHLLAMDALALVTRSALSAAPSSPFDAPSPRLPPPRALSPCSQGRADVYAYFAAQALVSEQRKQTRAIAQRDDPPARPFMLDEPTSEHPPAAQALSPGTRTPVECTRVPPVEASLSIRQRDALAHVEHTHRSPAPPPLSDASLRSRRPVADSSPRTPLHPIANGTQVSAHRPRSDIRAHAPPPAYCEDDQRACGQREDAQPSGEALRETRVPAQYEDRPARAMSPRSRARALRAHEERQLDAEISAARAIRAAAAAKRSLALSLREDIREERNRTAVRPREDQAAGDATREDARVRCALPPVSSEVVRTTRTSRDCPAPAQGDCQALTGTPRQCEVRAHAASTQELSLRSMEASRAVQPCDSNHSSGERLTTCTSSARSTQYDAPAPSERAQRFKLPPHSRPIDRATHQAPLPQQIDGPAPVEGVREPSSPARSPSPSFKRFAGSPVQYLAASHGKTNLPRRSPLVAGSPTVDIPASRRSAPHPSSPTQREHWPTPVRTSQTFEATLRSARSSTSNRPSKALPAASTGSHDGSRGRHSPPLPSTSGTLDACPPSACSPSVSTDRRSSPPSQAISLPADTESSGLPPQRENLVRFWSSFLRKPQAPASV
ncbi:uncharacterized protein C8Q71DRAFT_724053 [Rhodofomes roseus]|uniref:Uncharacterized protein n=1 Tax=Rhodofomes roseus TaxID=34475 RepID=A0ABQ8KER3_9APHY|nr:uncharacterized protein C8Q71DRAFT_724053 [Rhodofomes roseus]KAH9836216.1 hypothetical protein C8Q71DRAFT_724053 [Rhodofomes roseus]